MRREVTTVEVQASAVEQEDARVARLRVVDELDRGVEVRQGRVGVARAQGVQRTLPMDSDDDGRGVDPTREVERVGEPGVARVTVTVDLELRHRESEEEARAHELRVAGDGGRVQVAERARENLGGLPRHPSVGERESVAKRGPGAVRRGRGSSEVVGSVCAIAHQCTP